MRMLANYDAGALLDQKPANLPQARARKRITFNAIMKQNDREIDGILWRCSALAHSITSADLRRGCLSPAMDHSCSKHPAARSATACFHDEHSSCLFQISARAKSLNAGSSASSKSAFQPRCAVI